MDDRLTLRTTFNEVAGHYGGRRPPHPASLLDVVVDLADLREPVSAVEIGPGTGEATIAMAERGWEVLAVELGSDLAEVTRTNVDAFPNVTVVNADFDEWTGPHNREFDLVIAVGAWHWLDPDNRSAKAATLLREGGALAVLGGHHVQGSDTDLFHMIQRCYEEHDPAAPVGFKLPDPNAVAPRDWGISADPAFGRPRFHRWLTEVEYGTTDYISLIRTMSGTISLSHNQREALCACVADTIDSEGGGRIRRTQLFEVCVARRISVA